ncbi:serine hydrolase domain-containing protein [Amycolatopsis orientalis]|uniref:serine hydrolase domain-containing protein n=1 Tax=Amycolatopsis orientalis TaxID=31958 RepID=UPI000560D31D|nr:serine hydrolase [Amycolatopsis orientalis]
MGLNQTEIDKAIEFAKANSSETVRVYRNGCLVAENSDVPEDAYQKAQSWSVAKSVTSLAFGRAWTLGLISPDDPIGALFPEADIQHGALTMRHLLTMTAGNDQQVMRDFNTTLLDRIVDGLTTSLIDEPGKRWNYWQSGVALVAEAIGRAARVDFQVFLQEQLFTPIGIDPGTWSWGRDYRGHTLGFYDLHMTADAYGRLGELMRRGGIWNSNQVLSNDYVKLALQPIEAYPCYGFLIWRTAVKECNNENMLGLPEDMFQYAGMKGQLVTVFPSQGVVTVRTGGSGFGASSVSGSGSGGAAERRFHDLVLGAIEDDPVATPTLSSRPDIKHQLYGSEFIWPEFGGALRSYLQAGLPPAGPWRSRATVIGAGKVTPDGRSVYVELKCPLLVNGASPSCEGKVNLDRSTERSYNIGAGERTEIWFPVDPPVTSEVQLAVRARTFDATDKGTISTSLLTVRPS